jgi:hypothetical protein
VIENVVESGDGRMAERSEELRLVLQARASFGAPGELIGKDLESDLPSETCVARAPDDAHAAGAERTQDLERTQAQPGTEAHGAEE